MPASANDIGVLANFLTPRGFEKLDLTTGAKTLTPPELGIDILALIQTEGGDARYRDDSTSPTDASGYILFEKINLQYNIRDLKLIEFIQADTATPADCINVLYYSFATVGEVKNPPPPVFCSLVTLAVFAETLVTSVITDNNIVTTATDGETQGSGIYTASDDVSINVGADTVVAELTINSISDMTDGSAALIFSTTNFLTGDGFVIEPNTGAADGIIRRNSDSAVLLSGLSLTIPYTAQLIVNGDTGDISFNDGVNSTLISNVPTIGSIDGTFSEANLPPSGNIGETIDTTTNLGSAAFAIEPPAQSITWCEAQQVSPFCPLISLTNVANSGETATVTGFNIFGQNLGLSDKGSPIIGVDMWESDQVFTHNAGFTSCELTFNSAVAPGLQTQMGMRFSTSDDAFLRGLTMLFPITDSAAELREATTANILQSEFTVTAGYVIMLTLNNATGELTYQDSGAESGSIGTFAQLQGVELKFIIDMRTTGDLSGTNTMDFDFNMGDRPFTLTAPTPNINYCK